MLSGALLQAPRTAGSEGGLGDVGGRISRVTLNRLHGGTVGVSGAVGGQQEAVHCGGNSSEGCGGGSRWQGC